VVWAGRQKRSLVGRFRSVNGCPSNLLTRQNNNQQEREFLKNGENAEIRRIRNNKPKCTKPEFPKDPAKCWRSKNKVRTNQNRRQNSSKKKTGEEAHNKVALQKWLSMQRGGNQQVKQNNSWLCGMGAIWCHAMLCMHVVDSRHCPVHCEHENSGAELSAQGTKQLRTRTEGQGCGQICCCSGVSWLVCYEGLSSALPPSRTRARSASAVCILASTLVPILGQG